MRSWTCFRFTARPERAHAQRTQGHSCLHSATGSAPPRQYRHARGVSARGAAVAHLQMNVQPGPHPRHQGGLSVDAGFVEDFSGYFFFK